MPWIEVEGTEAKVLIPTDKDGWQLYDMVGAGRAARALTAAMKRALKAKSKQNAIEIMKVVLNRYAEFGSGDTEPRVIAERCLSKGRGSSYSWEL